MSAAVPAPSERSEPINVSARCTVRDISGMPTSLEHFVRYSRYNIRLSDRFGGELVRSDERETPTPDDGPRGNLPWNAGSNPSCAAGGFSKQGVANSGHDLLGRGDPKRSAIMSKNTATQVVVPLQSLLTAMSDGVLITDESGQRTYANPALSDLVGMDPCEPGKDPALPSWPSLSRWSSRR